MFFGKSRNRYLRTIILGIAAMAVLVWSAVAQFDIPPRQILDLFIVTTMIVFAIIASAALAAGLWLALRRLWRRYFD